MEFVMNRDVVVTSDLGHTIAFEKGKPVYVPPPLRQKVREMGGASTQEEVVSEASEEKAEPVGDERTTAIQVALEKMKNRNGPNDFTATNRPKTATLIKEVGFDVSAQERDVVWDTMLAEGQI